MYCTVDVFNDSAYVHKVYNLMKRKFQTTSPYSASVPMLTTYE